MAKLAEKQRLFVEEYLIDLNATQAAIRAGYSPRTAQEQGSRLLSNAMVRACVDKALAERSKRTGVNAERVVRELAKLGFVNAADVINFREATVLSDAESEDLAAIASVKVKVIPTEDGDIVEREVKMYDKTKALELLGRHLGLFDDKLTVQGAVPVQIIDNIPVGDNDGGG